MIYIVQAEHYSDTQPIKLQLTDEDGTGIVLTGCTLSVVLTDSAGTATTIAGKLTGNAWDNATVGKFHFTPTTAQTNAMALGYGNIRVAVTFADAAIRKTRLIRFKVES